MIRLSFDFSVKPEQLYQTLISEEFVKTVTNTNTSIEVKPGGFFSMWDGFANGTIVELVVNQKIVMRWRAADWPEGEFSTVMIILHPSTQGTTIDFIQADIPQEFEQEISNKWIELYWRPLQFLLS